MLGGGSIMGDVCMATPPSKDILHPEPDCNSNNFIEEIDISKEGKMISSDESKDHCSWKERSQSDSDYSICTEHESSRESQVKSPNSPSSIFAVSLHQKDISYDDLSKNIDANLAEIDMETFRSEDIHSILALPAIYTGDFQSASHGEQYASVSGSLLGGLDLDSSISPRISEDEISICKDEPLFSPLREPHVPEGTISVDSLDCSSLEEHDLVLTCKANKNNYTIAFEGSGTQFSDDSDYHEVCGISEKDKNLFQIAESKCRNFKYHCGSMVQSDLVFTTWSKLKRSKNFSLKKQDISCPANKSRSLPNLSHQSVFTSDKQLAPWIAGTGACLPLYDVQSSQSGHFKENSRSDSPQSVSLFKLFIKHRISNSSECGSVSSSQSESSSCVIMQNVNYVNTNIHNATDLKNKRNNSFQNTKEKAYLEKDCRISTQDICRNDNDTDRNNTTKENCLKTTQQLTEANNNTINALHIMDNNVIIHSQMKDQDGNGLLPLDSEEDNSQYFEDSLVEVPAPQLKNFHAAPIREEEETDISSADEPMRESRDPFGSDTGSSGEGHLTKINAVGSFSQPVKQDWVNSVDRINNVLSTGKSNALLINNECTFNNEKIPLKKLDFCSDNHCQSTQTKHFNSKEDLAIEGVKLCHSGSNKENSNILDGSDVLNNARCSPSRDSSPFSSGYASSRQSSIERLRCNSQAFIKNSCTSSSTLAEHRKSNVTVSTTRSFGTQIPVYVKDMAIQTSLLDNNDLCCFTIKDSFEENSKEDMLIETDLKSDSSSKSSHSVESRHSEKKPVYVCYPNYSLPDLSFLKSIASLEGSEIVYLAPTKYRVPQNVVASERQKRPKSCPDIETLSEEHLTHIKDWDSLNVLLPEELKNAISQLHNKGLKSECTVQPGSKKTESSSDVTNSPTCSCLSSDDNISSPPLLTAIHQTSKNNIRTSVPRSILRKSSTVCGDKPCHLPPKCPSASSVDIKSVESRAKRLSLQDFEYLPKLEDIGDVNEENIKTIAPSQLSAATQCNQSHAHTVQGMQPKPCNSTFILNTKSGTKKDSLNSKLISDCHAFDLCFPCAPSPSKCNTVQSGSPEILKNSPCHLESTENLFKCTAHMNDTLCNARVNEKIPQPLNYVPKDKLSDSLHSQLHHLLSSNSSLSWVAAALLAAHSNNNSEDQKHLCSNNECYLASPKGKKAVSFSENVAIKKDEISPCCMKKHCVPHFYEESSSKQQREECQQQSASQDDLDLECPPHEFAVSPPLGLSPLSTPSLGVPVLATSPVGVIPSHLFQEMLKQKTGLVEDLQKAVEVLVAYFDHREEKEDELAFGTKFPLLIGNKVLSILCPAVKALVSDGLLPTVPGFFGPLPNTPWQVAEASIQQGENKRELQDLLTQVNREKMLQDNSHRFNAFLIGLLNLGCLDWWMGHLCTCQSLICHHYHPTALFSLLTLPAATHLRDELKGLVRPLSTLTFNLDLLLETKLFRLKKSDSDGSYSVTSDIKGLADESSPSHLPYLERKADGNAQKIEREDDGKEHFLPLKSCVNEMESKDHQESPLWPGITIYPFSHVKSPEDPPQNLDSIAQGTSLINNLTPHLHFEFQTPEISAKCYNHNQQNTHSDEDDKDRLNIPEASLCSSTDSGCSSQADHLQPFHQAAQSGQIALKNNQEGQQFQKLRQKWEEMTSSPDSPPQECVPPPHQISVTRPPLPNCNKVRQFSRVSGKSLSPPSVRMPHLIHGRNSISNNNASRRETSHSPVPRKTSNVGRFQTPTNVSANRPPTPDNSRIPQQNPEVKKRIKSNTVSSTPQAPVARKSLIPVHRIGLRTRSSSRENGKSNV